MRNLLIILSVIFVFISNQTYAQHSIDIAKIGSNKEVGKYANINNSKIYYETYGKGMPLLLLHGGLGSIKGFNKCIPTLASHFKVIAIDSPGHGRSTSTDSLSYQFLADQISKFIDYLNVDSLYVMGWSDGGVISLLLASDRPDKVKKIIAVGANSRLDGINDEGVKWMRDEMLKLKDNKNWLASYSELAPDPSKATDFVKHTQQMWLAETYIPETKIKSINIPTMIVQGDRDEIKVEHSIELYRTIKSSQLCVLPNTSHSVFAEKPELIDNIAISFFNSK